jgi:hypothetical protein
MSRKQRTYGRKFREQTSLGAPSLKPFLFVGKAGPRLRFCEQEAFQLDRRRFLGKLPTSRGLLMGFLGAHARSPRAPAPLSLARTILGDSLIVLWRMRQFVAVAGSRYPQMREVWQCCGSLNLRVHVAG